MKNLIYFTLIVTISGLISCGSGGGGDNPTPSPTISPTPSPPVDDELKNFFAILSFSSESPAQSSGWPKQLSFVFNHDDALLNKLQVSFYQLPQCNVYLTGYSISGSVDPLQGYYTTNNQSSYYLCNKFSFQGTGCVIQSMWTSSIKFEFYDEVGKISESCISSSSSQSNNLGQIADYINAYYSRQCNNGGSCGFYDAFIFDVN
ncbi:MAG: hypothetical protein E6Q32_02390 [Neisseriales bacterium]|nr:MAG: hypothetical protein E6Q32_02390 [Neisseriales bacterium]